MPEYAVVPLKSWLRARKKFDAMGARLLVMCGRQSFKLPEERGRFESYLLVNGHTKSEEVVPDVQ